MNFFNSPPQCGADEPRPERLWRLLFAAVVLSALLVGGCANSYKTNSLKVGMSRQEVVSVMGEPEYTSAQDRWESMYYDLTAPSDVWSLWGGSREYYVRLLDGRVQSFGRR